ncbi:hypothetical protein HMPREF1869_01493, partial [Bacteroidales bacterium KA00251]
KPNPESNTAIRLYATVSTRLLYRPSIYIILIKNGATQSE